MLTLPLPPAFPLAWQVELRVAEGLQVNGRSGIQAISPVRRYDADLHHVAVECNDEGLQRSNPGRVRAKELRYQLTSAAMLCSTSNHSLQHDAHAVSNSNQRLAHRSCSQFQRR